MNIEIVREMLKSHDAARVIFIKADGTERNMLCTQKEAFIPDSAKPIGKVYLSPESSQVRVYDLEKREWRSFLAERVIDFIPIDDLEETFNMI